MRKIFFTGLLAVISIFACVMSFAACGSGSGDDKANNPSDNGNNDSTSHNWSSSYTEDGDRHYQICVDCDEKKYSDHNYGTSGVCVCGKVKPVAEHTHNYQWVDNGDTHKQHCSVSGCGVPDINSGTHDYGTSGVCVCGKAMPVDGHTHNYQWVDNGDGTHKQHCSVSGCTVPDVNTDSHNYSTNGVCVCGKVKSAGTQTQYNVIFNANGGTIDGNDTKTIVGNINQTITRPNDPVRTDYTFTGWYKDGATTVLWNFDTDTVKNATTLYAGWEINIAEYDVTFIHNYSGSANIVKSTENGLITYIPVRTGYYFNGWWYSDGQIDNGSYILSEKFDTSKRVTGSGVTLYAEWVQERTNDSQLYSPSVSISDDGVFSWDTIGNAQGYRVEVYSGSSKKAEETITSTNWTFPNGMVAGYYTVKIRANGDGEHTINSAYTEKYYAHHILSPVSGIEFNVSTSVLTWSAVKKATAYEIRVNNTLKETISYTTCDLSDLDAGDYTVSVTATREGYSSSSATNSISKKRLKSPNVTLTENVSDCTYTLSWEAVTNADTYRIKHHETYINVTGTSYTINNDSPIYDNNGVGEFTVCAYDSNADYFISADSDSVEVKKIYTLTLNKSHEDACHITYTDCTSEYHYYSGDIISASVTINMGYTWLGWYHGEQKISDNKELVFSMPGKNVTYTAKFEIDSLLTVFNFTSTTTTLTVTGLKDQTVTQLNIPNSVTSIGNLAFNGCTEIKNVTIGSGVKSIGYGAFFDCSSLTNITIPSSLKSIGERAFSGCTEIKSVTIGSGVKSIGYAAFDCNSLASITYIGDIKSWCEISGLDGLMSFGATNKTLIIGGEEIIGALVIPNGVTSISDYAFCGCGSITSIEIPNGVASIGSFAFFDTSVTSIIIPDSVTSIGRNALDGCYEIMEKEGGVLYLDKWVIDCDDDVISVRLRYNTVGIGDDAFSSCWNLTSIIIPDGVKSIGNFAFGECKSLTSIIIPDSVTSIGQSAFSGCKSLTSITIPDSVTSIGESAFIDCNNLSYNEFDNAYYLGNQINPYVVLVEVKTTNIKNFTISSATKFIYNGAFFGCNGLTSITIPNSVTSIGGSAFMYCRSLTNVTIPNSVINIGRSAFYGCSGLTSITIPSSVTSIGGSAFYGCSSLTNIIYGGAEKQWESIIKYDYWCYNTGDFVIICTDSTISKSEN